MRRVALRLGVLPEERKERAGITGPFFFSGLPLVGGRLVCGHDLGTSWRNRPIAIGWAHLEPAARNR